MKYGNGVDVTVGVKVGVGLGGRWVGDGDGVTVAVGIVGVAKARAVAGSEDGCKTPDGLCEEVHAPNSSQATRNHFQCFMDYSSNLTPIILYRGKPQTRIKPSYEPDTRKCPFGEKLT